MHVPFRFKVLTQNGLEFLCAFCFAGGTCYHGICDRSSCCAQERAGASPRSHLGCVSWWQRVPSMKQPCSGAQFSRSSMFHSPLRMFLMFCRQESLRSAPCPAWTRVRPLSGGSGRIPISVHCDIQSEVGGGRIGYFTDGRLGALSRSCRDLVRYAGVGAGERALADRHAAGPCQSLGAGRYPRAVVEALARMAPGTASVEGTRVRDSAVPRSWTSLRGRTGSSCFVFAARRPRGGHGGTALALCLVRLSFGLALPQM